MLTSFLDTIRRKYLDFMIIKLGTTMAVLSSIFQLVDSLENKWFYEDQKPIALKKDITV